MVNILYLSERVKIGLHELKAVILSGKANNVLGGQKSMNMRNNLEALLDVDCC